MMSLHVFAIPKSPIVRLHVSCRCNLTTRSPSLVITIIITNAHVHMHDCTCVYYVCLLVVVGCLSYVSVCTRSKHQYIILVDLILHDIVYKCYVWYCL